MKRRFALPLVLACLALAACDGVDPDSPLGKRQAIFKDMLKTSEDLGGMLRGRLAFDEQRFVSGAAELERLARAPWQYFPQAKEAGGDSRAKDEVWQRQARFAELARDLEEAAAALVVASQAAPLEARELRPAMQRLEDSCKACHQEFRAY